MKRRTNAIENLPKQKIASGFWVLERHGRFRYRPAADRVYQHLDLWPRLLGGPAQHVARGLHRHRAGHILGFIIGIARLSKNWLVQKIATIYVELIRNTPLLLQLLFWYNAVLKALPEVRNSAALPGGTYLNNRGLFMPNRPLGPPSAMC